MAKENYFFRKNSFGIYLSPERKEILEQNYETVFGTDADLKPAEAFWILFETALNQNTAKCNIKELEEKREACIKLQSLMDEQYVQMNKEIEYTKILNENQCKQILELNEQLDSLKNAAPQTVEVTKEVSVEVPAKVGDNQILITFSGEQKAMLDETRKLLAERNINWSNDEILARLFVDFTIKGPCDFYPRVLKSSRIKEIIAQFKPQDKTENIE